MKKNLIAIALLTWGLSACATDMLVNEKIEVYKAGDQQLSCFDLYKEQQAMSEYIEKANLKKETVDAAGTGVSSASSALSAIPFLGTAVRGASSIARSNAAQGKQEAYKAEQRRTNMARLFDQKGCNLQQAQMEYSRYKAQETAADGKTHFVTANSLNLRAFPSSQGQVLGKLTRNEPVSFSGAQQSGWMKISTSYGEGWVSAKYLTPLQ